MAIKAKGKRIIVCLILLLFFVVLYATGVLKFSGNVSVKSPVANELS